MVRVQARCTTCDQQVEVDVTDLEVDVPDHPAAPGHAAFTCPSCHAMVALTIQRHLAVTLRDHHDRPDLDARLAHPSAGLRPDAFEPAPAPPPAPPAPPVPSAPPLNRDDLLDFHELLQRDDWFDQLLTTTGGTTHVA